MRQKKTNKSENTPSLPVPIVRNTIVSQYCNLRDNPIFMGVRGRGKFGTGPLVILNFLCLKSKFSIVITLGTVNKGDFLTSR